MGWGLESLWPCRLGPRKPALRVNSSRAGLSPYNFLASVPTHLQTFPRVELWLRLGVSPLSCRPHIGAVCMVQM